MVLTFSPSHPSHAMFWSPSHHSSPSPPFCLHPLPSLSYFYPLQELLQKELVSSLTFFFYPVKKVRSCHNSLFLFPFCLWFGTTEPFRYLTVYPTIPVLKSSWCPELLCPSSCFLALSITQIVSLSSFLAEFLSFQYPQFPLFHVCPSICKCSLLD